MDYSKTYQKLITQFPDFEIYQNHLLAPHTTLKIGGPVDIFIKTKNDFEFKSILKYLYNLPITILGNGSNVLISDSGIRGIVINPSSQKIDILNNHSLASSDLKPEISSRRTENEPEKYLNFQDIDYNESQNPTVKVKISAAVSLPYAINFLIGQGVTGLQWFAYIPGTIGGAVICNIHGGHYHFSDYIEEIKAFDLKSQKFIVFNKSDLKWDYGQSYFQQHPNLVIFSVTLKLFLGDKDKAKSVVQTWIQQKIKVQLINSAGSVFKNPSLKDCFAVWGEQKSAGWIIDHELKWKGKTINGAQISQKHANIIINTGNATAKDYFTLAQSIKQEIKNRFNIDLEMEVKLLGEF